MTKEKFEQNLILKLSFDFALLIIPFCERLNSEKKYVIARQLLKSGTSVGAHALEAQNGESKADLIHKLKIAAKQAEETKYWLLLFDNSKSYPDCKELLVKIGEIILLAKSFLPLKRSIRLVIF